MQIIILTMQKNVPDYFMAIENKKKQKKFVTKEHI